MRSCREHHCTIMKEQKKSISVKAWGKTLATLFPLLAAAGLSVALAIPGNSLLQKIEIRSLFLFDRQFLADSFGTPGGFIGLAGQFLRQFLHIPWLGALLWTSMLYLSGRACVRLFSIPRRLLVLGYMPALILLWAVTSMGYLIFVSRAQDYFFAPVLGLLASLLLVWAVRKTRPAAGVAALIIVTATAGYAIAGYYAIAALAAVAADLAVSDRNPREKYILAALAVICAAALPFLMSMSYTTVRMDRCWLSGLPSVSETGQVMRFRLPFIAAGIATALLPVAGKLLKERECTRKDMLMHAAAIAVCAVVTLKAWNNDQGFVTELKVEAAAAHDDWKSIPAIVKDAESRYGSDGSVYEPTRIVVLFKDLALFKLGKEGDIAFSYPEGGRMQEREFFLPITYQAGQLIYLNWGLPNYCHRWCVETAVEYGWNYEVLRNISMAAMASGEWETARMYLNILSKTLFYRKWAKSQLDMCGNAQAVAQAEPYRSILPLMKFENSMTNDEAMAEKFLINHFTARHPSNASPEYDRAALFWAARSQDIDLFWRYFYFYINSNQVKTIPRHYQEAIQLYSQLEPGNGLNIPVDKNITLSYQNFMKFVQTHPVESIHESKQTYYPAFGNTFFYYYYFIRDIDTY